MIKDSVLAALDLSNQRRDERRRFLKLAGGAGAAAGGLALLSACGGGDDSPTPTPSPTPSPTGTGATVPGDVAILQLALNLEYLEAQFYSIAAFGRYLPSTSTSGVVGTAGGVTGGRQRIFDDPIIASYAREIAADEIAHVNALRSVITAASPNFVINQPAINIDGGANGAFTKAARAAKIIGDTETFDPYASDENFLLAAFLFEDVGVSAYKGASPFIANATYLEAAAGILAAEAYHAGLIRSELFQRGLATRDKANKIALARDSLDGSGTLDAGIATADSTNALTVANIVPADGNGIAYSRSTAQVHNVLYLTTAATIGGGFFPAGTNNSLESLRTSGNTAASPTPTPSATSSAT